MNRQTFIAIILGFLMMTNNVFAAFFNTPDNKTISYTDVGKGTPLVLIHAFPTDQRLWEPQRNGLKKSFRVITLDLQGFGKSSRTDGSAITMDDYALQVKQLLDHLQISKAIVGGESMGGYVTLAFMNHYPEKVSGLILSDTQSIADTDEAKEKREKNAQDILANGSQTFIDGFMKKVFTENVSAEKRASLENILTTQTANGMASGLRGMALRSDLSGVLENAAVPILIITGDSDAIVAPQQSEKMHKLAKTSQLVIIPNAGHLSSLEQPVAWNAAVVERFV